jgi:hypothetical protein
MPRVERLSDEPGRRQVRLPDDARLTVRAVAPSDADGLVALFDGLSDEDRHRRFFSGFRPPRSFVERLTTIVDRGGYGVVATVDDGAHVADGRRGGDGAPATARLVGEASYELLTNGDGELGITVAADQRGWLGPFLLDALCEAAAARGVPDLEADVLVTNRRMLALLRARGDASLGSDDWTTARVVVGTAGHTPTWPGGGGSERPDDRLRVLVEVPGGRWHARAEAEAAGLEVVACPGPRGTLRRCPVLAGRPCPLAEVADVIVASNVPDDERWRRVVDAHPDLHPGVPVCVERRTAPSAGPLVTSADGITAAITVAGGDDPHELVALIDRLAAHHRRRPTAGPPAPPGGDLRP